MINRRQHKRIPIIGTATLKFENKSEFLSIQTLPGSISLGGIGLYSDDPIVIDTNVSITINFISDDGIRTDSIEGCVIYTKNIGGIYFMGIQFNEEINSNDQPSLYEQLQKNTIEYEKLSALGRLTANVAHEIRNPITVIGGLTERLKKSFVQEPKQKEFLDLISLEVKRLEEILKDVLIFSNKAVFKREMRDIHKIISSSLNSYEDKCKNTSIKVNKLLGDIPNIYIDEKQVRFAISNLISNAVDAMPDGGTLTIITNVESLSGKNYVTLKVIDTGVGISEEKLALIYEPFFTTKTTKQEAWLGLPITRKIVEGHGGLIKVDSVAGKGSTFAFYFPYRVK